MGRSRKPLSGFPLRGFESLSLRQIKRYRRFHKSPGTGIDAVDWFCGRLKSAAGLPVGEIKGGDVAQLGEHLVRNEGVVGSNPIISTSLFLEIVLGGELAVPCTRNPLQRG